MFLENKSMGPEWTTSSVSMYVAKPAVAKPITNKKQYKYIEDMIFLHKEISIDSTEYLAKL